MIFGVIGFSGFVLTALCSCPEHKTNIKEKKIITANIISHIQQVSL